MMPIQVKFCRPNEGEKYEPVFYNKCTSHVSESKIYICTLGMALTLYMSGIAFIRSDGDSANLQDAFSVVSSSGFIILFYLLCVIGGGLSYCEDCNSGFTRYAVVRGDAKSISGGIFFCSPWRLCKHAWRYGIV